MDAHARCEPATSSTADDEMQGQEAMRPIQEIWQWVETKAVGLPPEWAGILLPCSTLEPILRQIWHAKAGGDTVLLQALSQMFFQKLDECIIFISLTICGTAGKLAGAYRFPPCIRIARTGTKKRLLRATPSNLLRQGQWCLYCAAVNRAVLLVILQTYDDITRTGQGRLYQDKIQRAGSIPGAFMVSPCLTEVKAILISLKGLKHSGGLNLPITDTFTSSTPVDEYSAKGKHSCVEECGLVKSCIASSFMMLQEEDIDCKCPICMEVMFNPIGLPCGHIFCIQCLVNAGPLKHVFAPMTSMYLQLLVQDKNQACPMCRQPSFGMNPVHMKRLDCLIRSRYPKEWKEMKRNWEQREDKMFETMRANDRKMGDIDWNEGI